jgi:endonuclease III
MTPKTCHTFFERLKKSNPEPTTELNYDNGFQLLIAVILSAQATDLSVNKATQTLFSEAPTAKHLCALDQAHIESHIKSIGLYKTKAKNIKNTSLQLEQHYNGEVPQERVMLEALPGVGRKTANVVLNTLFKQPTLAVDTHVFRVSNRTGLAHGKTPLKVEQNLLQNIPKIYLKDAHHWLILHGRYTCTARKPKCLQCCVADLCAYPNKQQLPE